jgi:hypothetical protein
MLKIWRIGNLAVELIGALAEVARTTTAPETVRHLFETIERFSNAVGVSPGRHCSA